MRLTHIRNVGRSKQTGPEPRARPHLTFKLPSTSGRVADQAAPPAASSNLGAVVVVSLLLVCLSARLYCLPCLSVRLSRYLTRLSALLPLSVCPSASLLSCQLKCRPRAIKFLAKFIRDFCHSRSSRPRWTIAPV